MSTHFLSKALISGLLVAAGFFAVAQTSVAATARLKWTPPYGAPFPNLEWFGEAEVTDGGCPNNGSLLGASVDLNFGGGPCTNKFSVLSASLSFAQKPAVPGGDILGPITTINLAPAQFGKVAAVERTSTDPDDWTKVYSSAFRAVQVNIPQTLYDPIGQATAAPAWFSLIFVGGFAQLIWFKNDPGEPIFTESPLPLYERSLQYAGCYLLGSGDKRLPFTNQRCGLSDANNAAGAKLQISVVPEPQAYLMALVSLGVLGAAGSVSRRRKAKH